MIVAALFFYLFAGDLHRVGFMVIAARNPVHSVLFLILAFVNAAGLFMLMGAEFLAMILVVVYVGAVAVLFLFVVMMLDVDFAELRQGFLQYLPVGALVGVMLLVELLLVVGGWAIGPDVPQRDRGTDSADATITNTEALGQVLYTRYIYFFQAAGMVLLVAMIGAIVLTLRHKPRRQAPEHRRAGRAHQARPRSRSSRSDPGQGLEPMIIGLGHYLDGRRDPVHDRHLRHLPQPQERHRHPDVDRAHPARRQHQPRRILDPSGRTSSARSIALLVLTVAAAEAAVGLAISWLISEIAAASRSKTSIRCGLSDVYQAIVFLPLLGAVIAGADRARGGACARHPGANPPAGRGGITPAGPLVPEHPHGRAVPARRARRQSRLARGGGTRPCRAARPARAWRRWSSTTLLFFSCILSWIAFADVGFSGHEARIAGGSTSSPPAISRSTGRCASTR